MLLFLLLISFLYFSCITDFSFLLFIAPLSYLSLFFPIIYFLSLFYFFYCLFYASITSFRRAFIMPSTIISYYYLLSFVSIPYFVFCCCLFFAYFVFLRHTIILPYANNALYSLLSTITMIRHGIASVHSLHYFSRVSTFKAKLQCWKMENPSGELPISGWQRSNPL